MKSRKTMAKSLLFAMTLGTLPFLGLGLNTVKASAAAPAAKFDGVSGIIKTDAPTTKVVWGVAKKLKSAPKAGKVKAGQRKLGDTWYSIKDLENAYGGEIDLNAVAKGKAVNIVLIAKAKENTVELATTDFKLFEIEAPDKNFKVVYSADGAGLDKTDGKIAGEETSGYLAFFKSGASKKAEQFLPSGDDVQLKKGKNGKWLDLKSYFEGGTFDDGKADKRVETLTQTGSELFFRLKADTSKTGWVSKEVKVKVAKRSNAPKVKVDVHKDIVKLKKGMKYKVTFDTTEEEGVADGKADTFEKLKIKSTVNNDIAKLHFIEVTIPGKGKKLASKTAKVFLKRQDAPFKGKDLVEDTKDTLKVQGGIIVDDKKDTDGNALVTLNLAVPYDPSKGAVLENFDTTKDYEFFVDWDGTATSVKKWIPLKKAKDTDKPTKVKIKTSDSKKDGTFKVDKTSDSKLKIRVAGDDKSSADVVTLGSDPLEVKLKLEKLAQEIKKQSGDEDAPQDVDSFEANFKGGTEYSFKVYVKALVNKEAKPKLINVSKVDGVSVKADPFDGSTAGNGSVSTVNIKVAENKQASIEGKKLTFEFVVEGVKEKFDITLKK